MKEVNYKYNRRKRIKIKLGFYEIWPKFRLKGKMFVIGYLSS